MHEQMRRLLETRIDELPLECRIVLVLRGLERMTFEEISSCLGVPEATIRTRFFRARRLLLETLTAAMIQASKHAFTFDQERCDRMVSMVLRRIAEPPGDDT